MMVAADSTLLQIIVTIFQCTPVSGFWNRNKPADCTVSDYAFFIGNAVPNIVTDLALLLLPLPCEHPPHDHGHPANVGYLTSHLTTSSHHFTEDRAGRRLLARQLVSGNQAGPTRFLSMLRLEQHYNHLHRSACHSGKSRSSIA